MERDLTIYDEIKLPALRKNFLRVEGDSERPFHSAEKEDQCQEEPQSENEDWPLNAAKTTWWWEE